MLVYVQGLKRFSMLKFLKQTLKQALYFFISFCNLAELDFYSIKKTKYQNVALGKQRITSAWRLLRRLMLFHGTQ